MAIYFPHCFIGFRQLGTAAHQILKAGLATSTISTYSAGKRRYLQFCRKSLVIVLPATELTFTMFVTYLATNKISHASIKVYLSAVRHMHAFLRDCTMSSPSCSHHVFSSS